MRLAVRPYLTTGVAIIGASVLIANPATLPSLELPSIQQIAASAPRLPNPGDALNASLAGLLDLLPGGSTATAQTSSPAADALIAAIVVAGSTQVGVTINTPVEILAAAEAIAENPDQLPQEALTKLFRPGARVGRPHRPHTQRRPDTTWHLSRVTGHRRGRRRTDRGRHHHQGAWRALSRRR